MKINDVYDSGMVRRYHTVPDYSGGAAQTTAEHSWGVALLALELANRINSNVGMRVHTASIVAAALTHDSEEGITGDAPAPLKWRFPVLAKELENVERTVRKELGIDDATLLEHERAVLRWADSLELYAYAQRRVRDGCSGYRQIVDNVQRFMLDKLPRIQEAYGLMQELTL